MTSWTFTLPGQPPSWNSLYEIVTKYRYSKRLGCSIPYASLAKTEAAVIFERDAILIIRSARPSNWHPTGDVSIVWRLYLSRWVDCDNLMKVVHDAIEAATGINDRHFLPCVQSRVVGVSKRDARIEIDVREL